VYGNNLLSYVMRANSNAISFFLLILAKQSA